MRPALVTILPMIAAAVLVMVGGERMARRVQETRSPFDRGRLLDFDEAFRGELERLDKLYLSHLDKLATRSLYESNAEASTAAEGVSGVRMVRVFRASGQDLNLTPGSPSERLPEIELEGRKRPLNIANAVVIPTNLLSDELPESGRWLPTPDSRHILHCRQPEPGVLAAFLIDRETVRARTREHLLEWIEAPITPLREAGERVVIEADGGTPLATTGPDHHGPAATFIPIRTAFGDWQIKVWDGLTVVRHYDPATLAVTSILALGLVISGLILYGQQRRALQQAAERVSFVNRVSHELGSPLTNLALNLDLATEALDHRPREARKRLDLVAEEIERLARLVANVLTFSRRERDTLELNPVRCQPAELVARTLESFRPALARRGIEVEAEISPGQSASLDPDALCQITGNLISNVEKYATSGRWMKLVFRQGEEDLTVEVHDHGPGIPAADRERIFAPFERVLSATNEGSSGTGLGLSIAQDLARRMGGSLELAESTKGAIFRLTVSAAPALALVSPDAA